MYMLTGSTQGNTHCIVPTSGKFYPLSSAPNKLFLLVTTFGSISIRHRSDTFASDGYLTDINYTVFAIWDGFHLEKRHCPWGNPATSCVSNPLLNDSCTGYIWIQKLLEISRNMLTRWRHQTETLSALLALCDGNPPVTGGFPSQRPLTRTFDVFVDLRLCKRLSKRPRHRWFKTPSHSLWRQRNDFTLPLRQSGNGNLVCCVEVIASCSA